MNIIKLLKALIAAFAVLAGTNILFSLLSDNAAREKAEAYETRHILAQANAHLWTTALNATRTSRAYVVTTNPSAWEEYLAFRAELAPYGPIWQHLEYTGITDDEVIMLGRLFEYLETLHELALEAVDARDEGDRETAIQMVFSPTYRLYGTHSDDLRQELSRAITERLNIEVECAQERAAIFQLLANVAVVLFAVISVVGTLFALRVVKDATQKAREASEMNEMLINASPLIMDIWDRDFNILSTSQQAVDMFNLDRQQYTERFLTDLSPERQPCGTPSVDKAIGHLKEAFETGRVHFEWMHQNLEGEPIPAEITLVRFTRRGEDFVASYTVDLRPIKAALERERELASRLQLIHDAIPIGMNFLDEDFRIVDCNYAAYKNIFGFDSKEEYVNKMHMTMPEFQPDGQLTLEKTANAFTKVLEDGYHRYEWMVQNKNGEQLPLDVTAVRLKYDEGHIIVTYLQDLRGLRTADKRIREVEEINNIFLSASPLAINVVDENFNITDCNRQSLELFGYGTKEEYFSELTKLTPEFQPCGTASAKMLGDYLKTAMESGRVAFEWMHCTRDGEPMPTGITMVRFQRRGEFGIVTYTADLRPVKEAMQREQEANEMNQMLLDACPYFIEIWDDEANLIYANQRIAELLNLPYKEEFVDNYKLYSPANQPCGTPSVEKAKTLAAEALREGYARFEWIHLQTDGTPMPFDVIFVRLMRDGRYIVVGYNHELGPIKEAMQRERDAFDYTRLILDSAPFVINQWGDNYNLLATSQQAPGMYGLSSQEEYVKEFFNLSPEYQPDGSLSSEKARALLTTAYEEGRAQFEWMHISADGEPIPTEIVLVSALHKDKKVMFGYTIDLRRVKEAEDFTRLLLDNSPLLMEFWSEDGEIYDCNQRVVDVFGLSGKSDFIQRFYDFSTVKQPCGTFAEEKNLQMINTAMKEGNYRAEWNYVLPSGELLPAEATWVRLTHRGKPAIVVYSLDLRPIKASMERERELEDKLMEAELTELLQQEQQRMQVVEESNQAKSRFLARMSHEIRTPITAVLGISEIWLQNPHLSPDLEESFAKIHNSSNLLLGIVNDILDLSRIEAGKMTLLDEKYEVATMISNVAHLHLANFATKSVLFQVKVDEKLPVYLIGDSLRIEQVVNNLLSNAAKYTESGSVEMVIARGDDAPGDGRMWMDITITDTGLGMTKEQLDALYNDYTRFHEREYRLISGTGLGMSIVYSLADLMDAKIELESVVGLGTKVMVRIPQEIDGAELLGREVARGLMNFEVDARSAAKKFKFIPEPMPYGSVLVVDDVDANLYVAKGLMAFYDLHIETCDNGREAIEKIKAGNVYDIIFMDHMMPGLDGTETMRRLRDAGYTQPIVVLTANALIGQAEEFIKNGFDGFVSKPINTVHLNAILTKHIRDKQPAQVIAAAKAARGQKHHPSGKIGIEDYLRNSDLVDKLRQDFARRNKNTYPDIAAALNIDDTKNAHFLAHTLKGVAGLIHEAALVEAARDVEHTLASGEMPDAGQLATLENELKRVLDSIGEVTQTLNAPAAAFDSDNAKALLDKLAALLESRNVEATGLLDELRLMPETAVLIRQIEEFEFAIALKNVNTLRDILGV